MERSPFVDLRLSQPPRGPIPKEILQEAASEALEAARQSRESGKGRRPSVHQIERLARRQGLANGDYSQALGQLRQLVERHAQNGHGGLTAALRDSRS
jgi:hypothetical protein